MDNKWLIAALFTLATAFGGALWKGMDSRVNALEKDKVDIATIYERLQNVKDTQQRLESNQEKMMENQQRTNNQINSLLQGVRRDSVRWNGMMDDLEKQKKKK